MPKMSSKSAILISYFNRRFVCHRQLFCLRLKKVVPASRSFNLFGSTN